MRPLSPFGFVLALLLGAGCGPPGCGGLFAEADPITAAACETGGGVWQTGRGGGSGTCRCYNLGCFCTIGDEDGVDSTDCTTSDGEPCQSRGCDRAAPPSQSTERLFLSDDGLSF